MTNSIYWYDYETFGIDPRLDRLAQFGGIRTDEELNIISDPLVIYCKPASDMLPSPQACLITGITPQKAMAEGIDEPEFISLIHTEFSQPGTCVAGYNNIRFDDEFTRHCLYRNFFNAYAHEWQHGNSRWDLIDVVRTTRALRPAGIEWPTGTNGKPSIRLELLTKSNNISHEAAHDAMSDVYATIEMAKLIRKQQPRLFDYMYSLRKKQEVSKLLNMRTHDAALHTSSRFLSERFSIAMVMPICQHPVNKNSIIVYDLNTDPEDFIDLNSDEIKSRLYTKTSDLPEGVQRVPLKEIHINKCPAVVPLKTMDSDCAKRLNINVAVCQEHRARIIENINVLADKTRQVFEKQDYPEITDPDAQLYSGGFFSDADNSRMERIRKSSVDDLEALGNSLSFDDSRLPEMLFRYRARNFPESLNEEDTKRWNEYRQQKFTDAKSGHRTLEQYTSNIEELKNSPDTTENQKIILEELLEYSKQLDV